MASLKKEQFDNSDINKRSKSRIGSSMAGLANYFEPNIGL